MKNPSDKVCDLLSIKTPILFSVEIFLFSETKKFFSPFKVLLNMFFLLIGSFSCIFLGTGKTIQS